MALFPLQHLKYPYHISSVFPPPALDSNGHLNGVQRSSPSSPRKPGEGLDFEIQMLDTLHIVDYRYSRFALDPRTGLFNMIRYVLLITTCGIRAFICSYAGNGEIHLGRTFRLFKMAFLSRLGASGLHYSVTTRSTLRVNLPCRSWSTRCAVLCTISLSC